MSDRGHSSSKRVNLLFLHIGRYGWTCILLCISDDLGRMQEMYIRLMIWETIHWGILKLWIPGSYQYTHSSKWIERFTRSWRYRNLFPPFFRFENWMVQSDIRSGYLIISPIYFSRKNWTLERKRGGHVPLDNWIPLVFGISSTLLISFGNPNHLTYHTSADSQYFWGTTASGE